VNELRRSDFDYALPAELIAQSPLARRSASRLLLLDGQTAQWQDRHIQELPVLLRAGDLLVLNDTRVLPARLPARKPSGGRVEIFLERVLDGPSALAQLRDSTAVAVGMALHHKLCHMLGGTFNLRTGLREAAELDQKVSPNAGEKMVTLE